jgi:ubiquitin-protein ligase
MTMSMVRLRRLQADYDRLSTYVRRQPRVQLVETEGDPPDRYKLEYRVRGLRQVDDDLQEVDRHLVEILLPATYPRLPPQCRMLTPIFHPNIAPHAICIGDHWSAGEPLVSIVSRIGEMITYQSYNTKSPLNGEAARWVTDNQEGVPLDSVSFVVDDAGGQPPQPAASRPAVPPPLPYSPAPAAPPLPVPQPGPPLDADQMVTLTCPGCQKQLRAPARASGKRSRCPMCQALFVVP